MGQVVLSWTPAAPGRQAVARTALLAGYSSHLPWEGEGEGEGLENHGNWLLLVAHQVWNQHLYVRTV